MQRFFLRFVERVPVTFRSVGELDNDLRGSIDEERVFVACPVPGVRVRGFNDDVGDDALHGGHELAAACLSLLELARACLSFH